MLTVKETNQKIIKETIEKLIKNGLYKNIDDFKIKNPSLTDFCFNNKLNFIMHSFSSQFTNDDYLILLNQLGKEIKLNNTDNNTLSETNINGNVFVDYGKNQDKTLVGIEGVNNQNTNEETFKNEEKYEKNEANFKNISDVNVNNLNNEQLQNLNIIEEKAESTGTKSNAEVYFDEYGNMTNIARNNDNGKKNYYVVDEINGNNELVGQKSTNPDQKTKVKSLNNGHNISSAFTNTLILSFVIGSFFGIVFLAIYLKIMH